MRVLVCDDSAVMRRVIRGILESEPGVEIVGVAHNGEQCVELAKRHRPDIITLDIEMPKMDGLTALRHVMAEAPARVIMVSSLTTDGSRESMKALSLGAADVVAKDHSNYTNNPEQLKEDIVSRVRALSGSRRPGAIAIDASEKASRSGSTIGVVARSASPAKPPAELASVTPATVSLIVIGSSTGGPPVLEHILRSVSAENNKLIVVAQHMPLLFTKSMASRLNEVCGCTVEHLDPGTRLEPGRVYIAPGGMNTHLKRAGGRWSARIDRLPAETVYFPSATALFSSAAQASGASALGIVLTGMGEDGGKGVAEMKAARGHVVAQSEDTCVVYGMPKAAMSNGADAALDPDGIAALLARVTAGNRAAA